MRSRKETPARPVAADRASNEPRIAAPDDEPALTLFGDDLDAVAPPVGGAPAASSPGESVDEPRAEDERR
ncbi:MAG TPA: hypothetical protein VFQ39_02655, partial [Longimicrobium sp.]|nr:hypothetical protein [Longimicrobium sp.]